MSSWGKWDWVNPMPGPGPALLLTPGQLMKALCKGWLQIHPEDNDKPVNEVFRKVLRGHAIESGANTFLMTGLEGEIQHFGMIPFGMPNG